jgi:hypothetical protein
MYGVNAKHVSSAKRHSRHHESRETAPKRLSPGPIGERGPPGTIRRPAKYYRNVSGGIASWGASL